VEGVLMVVGAVLAGFAALDTLRPGRGPADWALRALGGAGLLALALFSASSGAYAATVLAGAVALPLVAGPALPWAFSRMALLQSNRHGNARPHQP
jgi:hypothetical protein